MNKRCLKAAAIALGAGMVLSLAAPAATVKAENTEGKNDVAAAIEEKKEEVKATVKNALESKETPDKDETVYVLTDASGKVNRIIVSDRLTNVEGLDEIGDLSELKDIKNVKGKETFTKDGNALTWKAQGKEIVYRGETDKALPVEMKITYALDGKEVAPEELAGKSGHVTVTYELKNNEKAPFAAVTVLLFNNNSVKNAAVSRGSVSSDGTRTTVCGLAFPGFDNYLNTMADAGKITFECDAENFKLLTSLTVVTDEVFRGINEDTSKDKNDLNVKMAKFEKDCTELVRGTATLANAMNELSAGTTKLAAAVGQLDAGAGQLISKNETLVAGSTRIFDSILKTAYNSLVSAGVTVPELTRDNYAKVLDSVVSQMAAQLKNIPEGNAAYTKVQTGIGTVKAVKAQLDSVNTFCTGVKDYTDGVALLGANLSTLSAEVDKLDGAVKQIKDGADKLNDSLVAADLTGLTAQITDLATTFETSMDSLHTLLGAADAYSNYSGLAEGQTGSVRFVYRTASIGE
ncbi:MAG: hypothetical protein K6G60_05590 [Lachnospiraceae bacterium]|nr:hypothetical protein [Lachnospiraceae bacterium]